VAEIVARRLRKHDLRAGGVRVKLKTNDFRLLTRQAPLRPPVDSFDGLIEAGVELLDQFDLGQPMRLVGIAAFDLLDADGVPQQELFSDERRERSRRLDRALDAVLDRFGDDAIQRGDTPRDRRKDGEPDGG
jgi:DNA polymerase-4